MNNRPITGWAGVGLVAVLLIPSRTLLSQPIGVPPEARKDPTPGMWGKSLVGGQLGPWFSEDLGKDITEPNARLDASSTAFHIEFFYQPHLTGILYLDLNLGAINRGDLRIRNADFTAFGDATLYPAGLGVVVYPLAKRQGAKIQPSVRVGGSFVIGTERLAFIVNDPGFVGLDSESRTTLGYYIGGGGNFILGSGVCLTGTVKYQHTRFNDELFYARDYSGMMILLGAAYMYK